MEIGWVNTPQDWRDVFIMSFMVAGTLLILISILFTVVIGFMAASAVGRFRGVVKSSLQPALENMRETSETLRGTVTFISDYAVTPVVRAYSAYAGARRFVVVLMRFTRPKRAG